MGCPDILGDGLLFAVRGQLDRLSPLGGLPFDGPGELRVAYGFRSLFGLGVGHGFAFAPPGLPAEETRCFGRMQA